MTRSVLALTLLAALAAHASEESVSASLSSSSETKRNLLSVHPSLLPVGAGVEYERVLNRHLTLFACGSIGRLNGLAGNLDIGARAYFIGAAPEGFWIGPKIGMLGGQLGGFGDTSGEAPLIVGTAGAMAGYTYVSDAGLALSAGVGVKSATTVWTSSPSVTWNTVPVLPDARLSIGWLF